jgi:hypothetical protein
MTTTSTVTSPTTEIETTEGPTAESITIGIGTLTNTMETVYGIWNTTAGGDSTPSTVGMGVGNYYPGEIPNNAFDNQTNTKYTNFGTCVLASAGSLACGQATGLYLTPQGGPSLLLNLQFCTGNDLSNRDPFTITVEGSNQSASFLTLGSSWMLIYNGSTGLQPITNRYTCGAIQSVLNNSILYSSYRILVTSKRGVEVATQYSEVKLMGYQ